MRLKSVSYSLWMLVARFSNKFVVGEHFDPFDGLDIEPYLKKSNKTALHHLLRYYWAVDVIKKNSSSARIIDFGCGSGYGSYLLAKSIPQSKVYGCDYDKKAILKAKKEYELPNLHFFNADLLSLTSSPDQLLFDYLVFFDTLEHLSNREIVLENILRLIKPDGELFLSTPCGHEKTVFSPPWPAHQIEYSYKDLYKFLRRYFNEVISPENDKFPGYEVFQILESTNVEYNHKMNPVICKNPKYIDSPYDDVSN